MDIDIQAEIAETYKALRLLEQAHPNVRGYFPRRHNASRIARLYDKLNGLHIKRIEAGLPFGAEGS